MSDQDDDKKNINQDTTDNESVNQPSVDENNQPESVESANNDSSGDENKNNEQNNDQSDGTAASSEKKEENKNLETQISESNIEENNVQQSSDTSDEKKDEDNGSGHQVIHKKDGRLHIYVRQDKYKGELKSKNWVGRLYIDGKQKISSSGTTNLEEAIPILEKWFDDIQEESERLKNQTSETQVNENQNVTNENISPTEDKQKVETPIVETQTQNQEPTAPVASNESTELNKQDQLKSKITNIFGKLKDIKLKKPSFANNLSKSSSNNSKIGNLKSKFESFFKSKLGKSSVQGEEILGVELANTEIRLVQVSSNKANQWVLDKFHIHPVDVSDDLSLIHI